MSYYRNSRRSYRPQTPRAEIRYENGALVLDCSYYGDVVM